VCSVPLSIRKSTISLSSVWQCLSHTRLNLNIPYTKVNSDLYWLCITLLQWLASSPLHYSVTRICLSSASQYSHNDTVNVSSAVNISVMPSCCRLFTNTDSSSVMIRLKSFNASVHKSVFQNQRFNTAAVAFEWFIVKERSHVLILVLLKMHHFWDVMLCC
jgi:hypothetical protein